MSGEAKVTQPQRDDQQQVQDAGAPRLVRMAKSGFPVRHVPREAVRSMVQNGWATSPLDVSTSGEQAEQEPGLSSRRPRRRTPSGDQQEGEDS